MATYKCCLSRVTVFVNWLDRFPSSGAADARSQTEVITSNQKIERLASHPSSNTIPLSCVEDQVPRRLTVEKLKFLLAITGHGG